jgi:LPXTG-motif cell wall-anchored protein
MALHAMPPRGRPVHSLADRAEADLKYIRTALERSEGFTCVSGRGTVAMGVVGTAAAIASLPHAGTGTWLLLWLGAAAAASLLGGLAVLAKAKRDRRRVLSAPGRRFLLGFLPPVLAGAALTAALVADGREALLPPLWLLLYGAGVLAGGVTSIPAVPRTGAAFMALGALALALPDFAGTLLLGLGFGLLQLAAGALIWRFHGG